MENIRIGGGVGGAEDDKSKEAKTKCPTDNSNLSTNIIIIIQTVNKSIMK